jgi:hypothetical protein
MIDTVSQRRYLWPLGESRAGLSGAVWVGMAAVVLVGLVGCRQGSGAATLGERVERYWELKQAKRWEEVYDGYLDPMLKSALGKDDFIEKRKLAFDILSYSVAEIREDGDEVTVRVANEANIPIPAGQGKMRMVRQTVTTEDQWVRRDGTWYVALAN